MDDFLERLERLEKIVEITIAKLDLHMAKKPREKVVLAEPKDFKPGIRIKREFIKAIEKLKKSPHYENVNNYLGLDLNININTIHIGPAGFTHLPKLSNFISQVADIDFSKYQTFGINPKQQLGKFCNYYLNRVDDRDRPFYTKYTHWDKAFGAWCRNAQKFNKRYSRPEEPSFQDEITRPDYEKREKREDGYEGGVFTPDEAYEDYEAEFLSR
jgi:hypothetical protein